METPLCDELLKHKGNAIPTLVLGKDPNSTSKVYMDMTMVAFHREVANKSRRVRKGMAILTRSSNKYDEGAITRNLYKKTKGC